MNAKLLIVDDLPQQREKVKGAAKEAGFKEREIVCATSVAEGETKLRTETFEVAVVDLDFKFWEPRSDEAADGLQFIQLIRRYQPECRIVALTTERDTDDGIRAMIAGAHDFVCSKWAYINWEELLVQKLRMWRGVAEQMVG
jgi:DNA-binding NarL/FixJ family response regulator